MRIGGVELHVEPPIGAGDPLVIVHGGWTDHTAFDAVVGPLARSFRVIRYDRRGHSRSEYGPGPAPRRRDEDDLAELIEAIGSGPVHLVGTSYGATISLALAIRPAGAGAQRSSPMSRRCSASSVIRPWRR